MATFHKWGQIPKSVKLFLFRGLVVFIIWKVLYLLFLLPNRTLDEPLTLAVGQGTIKVLNIMTHSQSFSAKNGVNEILDGKKRVGVEQLVEIDVNNEKA